MEDEKTQLVFHPTRLNYLKWYVIALFFFLLGIIIFSLPILMNYIYTIFILFTGLIFIVRVEWLRIVETYYLTNYRIIEKKGIINTNEDSIYWEKISNYSLSQNPIDRIFNIGTIRLYAMTGGLEDKEAEITIKKASNINKIDSFLNTFIERKESTS